MDGDVIHTPPGVEATGQLLLKHTPRFIPGADLELCLLEPREPDQRRVVVDWRGGAAQPGGQRPLTGPWAWLREHLGVVHLAKLDKGSLPSVCGEGGDGRDGTRGSCS